MSMRVRPSRAALRAALCVALGACSAPGPSSRAPTPDAAAPALDAITEADLRRDLHVLAGDGMRGREAGTLDELRASVWLADRMREAGLEPAGDDGTYFQWFPMRRYRQSADSRVAIGDEALRPFADVVVATPVDATIDAPLVFVEPGATPDSAAVRGKAVATVLAPNAGGRPAAGAAAVRQAGQRLLQLGAVAVVVASAADGDAAFARAGDAMARGRYGVDTAGATAYWPDARSGPARPQGPPILWVRHAHAERLRAPGQRLTARLTTENFLYPSVNVVGRVRGTDPALRDEYLLYSTHQDHDGVRTPLPGDATRDSIWNGADDNGTGSVASLAIARAFAQRPARRSVLFVWHGAEERGLLGSRYHVMHPVVPRGSIVAVLNGEMMGRNHPDSATILGGQPPHRNSAELVAMAERANVAVARFALDTLWDQPTHPERWYFRSDHLPYARVGIPAIAFSSNLHPDYHTPRDEPSRIDYGKLLRFTRWMYATGWLVANADRRPAADPGFRLER